MAKRQTASFLRNRFQEAGIRPNTRHGQNFLIDLNLVEFLANSAALGPRDVVLEVGTGTGSLTQLMAPQVAHIVTVEIDQQLSMLAAEELADADNVTMLRQDALRNKNNMHPNVLEEVQRWLDEVPDSQFKLAANLPYNVATPIISNLLRRDPVPVSMTVTIQKELAERIVAQPSTKDYSALSIWVQSLCDTDVLRVLPPTVFWPRPKVQSAIIQIKPSAEKRASIADLEFFHTFVRSMFLHRRKFLRSVILAAFKGQLDKPAVDEVMAERGLTGESRAEQLSVEEMKALGDALRAKVDAPAN